MDFSEALSQGIKIDLLHRKSDSLCESTKHFPQGQQAFGPGLADYNAYFQSSGYISQLPYCHKPHVPLGENYSLPSNHMTQGVSHRAANVDHMANN